MEFKVKLTKYDEYKEDSKASSNGSDRWLNGTLSVNGRQFLVLCRTHDGKTWIKGHPKDNPNTNPDKYRKMEYEHIMELGLKCDGFSLDKEVCFK